MISASALTRNCGHVRELRRKHPPTKSRALAAARGTAFHLAARRWFVDVIEPEDPEFREWIEGLAGGWSLPDDAQWEVPLGLGVDGSYVQVDEVEPHVYEPSVPGGVALVTAGRADVVGWRRGVLTVTDFKTGAYQAEPAETNPQLWALAIAAGSLWCYDTVAVELVDVRNAHVETVVGSIRPDSQWFQERFVDIAMLASLDETPRPGFWCAGCWERKHCKAALL